MKIYLAGKMDELGNWRDGLLEPQPYPPRALWHTEGNEDALMHDDDRITLNWPHGPNRLVLGVHDYTGPYRSLFPGMPNKWLGYLHGNEGRGQHGMMDTWEEHILAGTCLYRIREADVVFAYLNSFDSFGTMIELGYARALDKFVAVVENTEATGDESLWFASKVASRSATYSPTYWIDRTECRHDSAHERAFLRNALLEAISAYSADAAANKQTPADLRTTSRQSFQQIVRWTSDPRVRDEARRMIRLLEAGAA